MRALSKKKEGRKDTLEEGGKEGKKKDVGRRQNVKESAYNLELYTLVEEGHAGGFRGLRPPFQTSGLISSQLRGGGEDWSVLLYLKHV